MSRKWWSLIFLLMMAFCPGVPAEEKAEVDKVTLQLKWLPQAQFAGYYVARDLGYYKAERLEVTIRPAGPDILSEEQVAKGKAQFGVDWQPSMLTFREKGVPLKAIAQIFQYSGMRMISWKDSNIKSPADLKGKKVSVWFEGNEFELLATLAKHNLDPKKDLTLISQGFDMQPFLKREVDAAAAMTYNELAQVLETKNPAGKGLYQLEDLNIIDFNQEGTAMLEDRIFAHEDWLKDPRNQDIAVRFLRASIRGWIYCRDHPDESVALVLKADAKLGRGHQTWQLNEINKLIWPSPDGIGMMDAKRWQDSADITRKYGVLKKPADTSAYTNEFIQKALEGLKGVDLKGLDWKPKTVTLTEGGK